MVMVVFSSRVAAGVSCGLERPAVTGVYGCRSALRADDVIMTC
jgi:hypothetical protein